MRICKKCGNQLTDDDVFCSKCGSKQEKFDALSKEESIELADKLGDHYSTRQMLKEQISDCEMDLKRYNMPVKPVRYSAFRFFWPFLIIAQVAALVIGVIVLLVVISLTWSRHADVEEYRPLAYIVVLLVEAGTLGIGGVFATRKRDKLNAVIYQNERANNNRVHNIKNQLGEYSAKLRTVNEFLSKYEDRVPVTMRSKLKMYAVKDLIEKGEAEDFDRAIELLMNRT